MKGKSIIKILFYLYLVLLTCFSLLVNGQTTEEGIIQKLSVTDTGFVLHVIAYFVAAMLGSFVYSKKSRSSFFLVLISIFFFSYLLEIIQYFHPHRAYNLTDVAANGIGIVLFYVFYQMYRLISKNKICNRSAWS